ncbi:RNA polymerase sigma factor [Larkinella humicola]|uniref:Sigma-70 family RNA polymerase sigma factor n=1 Tax=Larkinella humicola TaxID=2607654 RepID=A0A5N1JEU4_9BACT|nr:sigma-70 family RNA polymerase sigma factor [Larkinella humicola]KAA9349636.1 sigma-70 family RNA polymerase sigma factor [Larkinella humicola]
MKRVLRDEELIGSYLNTRRADCLETLYKRYVHKVYGSCLTFTRDPVKAEDYTHDIFLQVFIKIDQFQGRSAFSTWLFSISQNYCRQKSRVANRMVVVAMDEVDIDNIPDSEGSDTAHAMLSQMAVVMEKISPDRMALLQLKYVDNIDVTEIARQYNINHSAVKMRLKRTREQVIDAYQKQFMMD